MHRIKVLLEPHFVNAIMVPDYLRNKFIDVRIIATYEPNFYYAFTTKGNEDKCKLIQSRNVEIVKHWPNDFPILLLRAGDSHQEVTVEMIESKMSEDSPEWYTQSLKDNSSKTWSDNNEKYNDVEIDHSFDTDETMGNVGKINLTRRYNNTRFLNQEEEKKEDDKSKKEDDKSKKEDDKSKKEDDKNKKNNDVPWYKDPYIIAILIAVVILCIIIGKGVQNSRNSRPRATFLT